MSWWHVVHVGIAKRCCWWQFLHSEWTGPRSFALVSLSAWHSLHRDHQACPAPGGSLCGAWHCAHSCFPPTALAASFAWQLAARCLHPHVVRFMAAGAGLGVGGARRPLRRDDGLRFVARRAARRRGLRRRVRLVARPADRVLRVRWIELLLDLLVALEARGLRDAGRSVELVAGLAVTTVGDRSRGARRGLEHRAVALGARRDDRRDAEVVFLVTRGAHAMLLGTGGGHGRRPLGVTFRARAGRREWVPVRLVAPEATGLRVPLGAQRHLGLLGGVTLRARRAGVLRPRSVRIVTGRAVLVSLGSEGEVAPLRLLVALQTDGARRRRPVDVVTVRAGAVLLGAPRRDERRLFFVAAGAPAQLRAPGVGHVAARAALVAERGGLLSSAGGEPHRVLRMARDTGLERALAGRVRFVAPLALAVRLGALRVVALHLEERDLMALRADGLARRRLELLTVGIVAKLAGDAAVETVLVHVLHRPDRHTARRRRRREERAGVCMALRAAHRRRGLRVLARNGEGVARQTGLRPHDRFRVEGLVLVAAQTRLGGRHGRMGARRVAGEAIDALEPPVLPVSFRLLDRAPFGGSLFVAAHARGGRFLAVRGDGLARGERLPEERQSGRDGRDVAALALEVPVAPGGPSFGVVSSRPLRDARSMVARGRAEGGVVLDTSLRAHAAEDRRQCHAPDKDPEENPPPSRAPASVGRAAGWSRRRPRSFRRSGRIHGFVGVTVPSFSRVPARSAWVNGGLWTPSDRSLLRSASL